MIKITAKNSKTVYHAGLRRLSANRIPGNLPDLLS